MNPLRPLIALLLLNAVGYVVALATGLADPLPGLLNGSKTNAPLIICGAQTLGVALYVRGRRTGAVLTLLASTVSLAAAALDGDLAAAGLGAGQVAIQLEIAATTAVLWLATAVSLARYGRAGCGDSSSSSRSSSSRLRRPRRPSGSSATT
jgi:uncharacterized oligopeptide transporter (OPT) family protein